MATIDRATDSTISSDALRMLDCFVSGLDSVVYEIAEEIARLRLEACVPAGGKGSRPTEIESEDVKKAVEFFAQCIKKLASENRIPADAVAHVEQMVECCRRQASETP